MSINHINSLVTAIAMVTLIGFTVFSMPPSGTFALIGFGLLLCLFT